MWCGLCLRERVNARFACLASIAAAVAAPTACVRHPVPQQFDGPTMGTTYSVVVTRLPAGLARSDVQALIDGVLSDIDRHLSTYDPGSEISRFNASARTDWQEVSGRLHEVVALARQVSRESGGAFDVTVGPLVQLWGFGADGAAMGDEPTPEAVERALVATGFDRLESREDGPSLRKSTAGLQLDVNGIAPGLAVDLIAVGLEAQGIRDYLVELGGEVRARGRSPAGRAWRIAVEAPVAAERRPYAMIELDDLGISTSGDYREFRIVGGRRLSHTIDPRTGAPVTHALASVSVVHRSTALADAYATALMVLGPREGEALARRLGLAALLIERDAQGGGFRERVTPEFARLRRPLD